MSVTFTVRNNNIGTVQNNSITFTVQSNANYYYPYFEDLNGTKDGVNKTFTLTRIPTTMIGINLGGTWQVENGGFTRSGKTITLAEDTPAPEEGEILKAFYFV